MFTSQLCPSLAAGLGPVTLSLLVSEFQFADLLNGDNTYFIGLWRLNVSDVCVPCSGVSLGLSRYPSVNSSAGYELIGIIYRRSEVGGERGLCLISYSVHLILLNAGCPFLTMVSANKTSWDACSKKHIVISHPPFFSLHFLSAVVFGIFTVVQPPLLIFNYFHHPRKKL